MCVHTAQCMTVSHKSQNVFLRQADATQEYFAKSAQWDREKKVRKARGLEWPCASCGLHFPANGFIHDSRRHASDQLANRDAIEEYCIGPGDVCHVLYIHAHVFFVHACLISRSHGACITSNQSHRKSSGHWRCCRACAGLRLDGVSESKPESTMHQCEKCRKHRPQHYFQESPSMCIACALHADFEIFPCGKCNKPTSMQHWSGRRDEYDQQLCTGCAPAAASLQCHFCKKTKSLQCFSLKCPEVKSRSMKVQSFFQ